MHTVVLLTSTNSICRPERHGFLQASRTLLTSCPHLHDSISASRLARAVVPSIATLLSTKSQGQEVAGTTASKTRNRKGKKRARGYEGDEVFNVTAEVISASKVDGDVLLASIDGEYLVNCTRHDCRSLFISCSVGTPEFAPTSCSALSAVSGASSDLRLLAAHATLAHLCGPLLARIGVREGPSCLHRTGVGDKQRFEQESWTRLV